MKYKALVVRNSKKPYDFKVILVKPEQITKDLYMLVSKLPQDSFMHVADPLFPRSTKELEQILLDEIDKPVEPE